MKTVTIKTLEIGVGRPKIIVPIIGKTAAEIIDEAVFLQSIDFDVLEWRVDHFLSVENVQAVKDMAKKINQLLPDKPILFTFRTINEGGKKAYSLTDYVKLNQEMARSKIVDLIDVELFIGDEYVKEIIDIAHRNRVFVISSNHDFEKTPSKNEIISRLKKMQELGADILKIAVMPQSANDVLTLLQATLEMNEQYATRPIITMSMDRLGMISRISGEILGSSMTFASAKKASAPGQIEVNSLRYILDVLYKNNP